MNNTIKNGWLFDCTDDSFEQLDKRIADAIYAYNYVRPHQGIQMRTPMEYIRKCSGKVAEVPLVGTGAPDPILMDYASGTIISKKSIRPNYSEHNFGKRFALTAFRTDILFFLFDLSVNISSMDYFYL